MRMMRVASICKVLIGYIWRMNIVPLVNESNIEHMMHKVHDNERRCSVEPTSFRRLTTESLASTMWMHFELTMSFETSPYLASNRSEK